MADNETQLTIKQRAFVDFYLGEANFNGTKAATMAGYAVPKQEATRLLSHAAIRKEVDEYFDSLKHEGLRSKNVRVKMLTDTMESLEAIRASNAKEAKAAIERGENVPEAALQGFHIKDVKLSANGKTSTQWVIDKTLTQERRATADQIAKELNDYTQKTELTGKDGGPVQIEAVDSAYELLMADIAQ